MTAAWGSSAATAIFAAATAARTSAGASLVNAGVVSMIFSKLGMIEVLLVFNSTPLLFED